MDGWSPALAVEGVMLGLRNFASSKPRRLNARRLSLADDDQVGHDQAARVLLPAFVRMERSSTVHTDRVHAVCRDNRSRNGPTPHSQHVHFRSHWPSGVREARRVHLVASSVIQSRMSFQMVVNEHASACSCLHRAEHFAWILPRRSRSQSRCS